MNRAKFIEYQDSYAAQMQRFGMRRGMKGSEANHITAQQYNRALQMDNESLQERNNLLAQVEESKKQSIEDLKQQEQKALSQYEQADILKQQKESELGETQAELKQVKGQLKTEKLKSTAADVGSSLIEGIGSMIGTSKVKVQQQEIENIRVYNKELSQEVKDLKQNIQTVQKEHETAIDKLKQELKKIYDLFPYIKELLRIENLCRYLGFTENLTKSILEMKPVRFSGKLYSSEYQRKFETEHSVAEIKPHSIEQGKLRLTIDGVSDTNWFRQKYQEFQRSIGVNIKPSKDMEIHKSKGRKQ
jgi:hypothetical protein